MIQASNIWRLAQIVPLALLLACDKPGHDLNHRALVESGALYVGAASPGKPGGNSEFETRDRIEELEAGGMYPCSDCHDGIDLEPNPTERILVEEHDGIELDHGEGRFWCVACHNVQDRDQLTNIKGEALGFNQAYMLCGQCHFQQLRDFQGGAHGKRLFSWSGPRTLAQCTECHNPHQPAIKKREPKPPPKPRRGLAVGGIHSEAHSEMPEVPAGSQSESSERDGQE